MSGGVRLAGSALRELRVHLCQKSASSKGARDFVEKLYVPLKKANPKFPILIRECEGVRPKLWARYDMGREQCVSLENMKAEDVLKQIESLVAK